MKLPGPFLTDAQLRSELDRCLYCEEKPCREACPAHCSPADFIMAARGGAVSDIRRAAALIMGSNPLGGVCGLVCPDSFCVAACSRRKFDRSIDIPAVQATIIAQASRSGPASFKAAVWNGRKIAVVGAGPAGLAAAGFLAQIGYKVVVFERRRRPGGMMNLIPGFRLAKRFVRFDIAFVKGLGEIRFRFGAEIASPESLLGRHDAVVLSAGLGVPVGLGIPGEEHATSWQAFLEDPKAARVAGRRVAVLGGGAVAADCAATAKRRGAAHVELIYRRRQADMPLTGFERRMLLEHGVEISSCSRPLALLRGGRRGTGLLLSGLRLPKGKAPRPDNFTPVAGEEPVFRAFDVVVSAIGARPQLGAVETPGIFPAGDMILGASTVVESVATGKNAAREADAFVRGEPSPWIERRVKSRLALAGAVPLPVRIEADFFGRSIRSPFLLSAAPHTDGYAQMRRAYERGWAGGVMKTAFDNVPIHIPGAYLFALGASTYGNCDNVSAHPLDRVCREVGRLVGEFPDRLTLASTGGPVTGNDEDDRAVWQSNTCKLEAAGAMGIEYSLSCPQGGDGTRGDVVSQDAALTAKIVGWVMEAGAGEIPKLFKLTAAVTAVRPVLEAVREVFERHPGKRAGITLANSFPSLAFRRAAGRRWEEGVVVGMSGEGLLPITNLALAKAAGMGVTVSANGGAMGHRDAAHFLALGATTVQFCAAVMKYGLGFVDDLHSGLSWLLEERRLRSVRELIGSALPDPITAFGSLSASKDLPQADAERCMRCGNCARCPYQAVRFDGEGLPVFDAARCIGCTLCAKNCFAGAIAMRKRTRREREALVES